MSEFNPLLSLERLELSNFRCFRQCSLVLHPRLTLLIAENGQGKTALLDAMRMALGVFITTIGKSKLGRAIENSDIHRDWDASQSLEPTFPARFSALGRVNGETISWGRTVNRWSDRARNSTRDLKEVQTSTRKLGLRLEQSAQPAVPVVLPVVAFYGTGRLFDEHRLTKEKHFVAATNPVRFSAYLDCLSPSSSYKAFAVWYEETIRKISDPAYSTLGPDERPEKAIIAVKEAVKTVLAPTGWSEIDWEFPSRDKPGRGYISVKHENDVKLPLSQLSDGVRNMVALVADIAHRCIRLNPHFGEKAARLTPGILLIDEIDMHLHPRWQQLIICLLREAFPLLQVIASTHSPHVLSTVDKDSIRIIALDENGNGSTPTPAEQTRGDGSGSVLARAMSVDPVPDVGPAKILREYRGLVQNGLDQSDRAQTIWQELVSHFGEQHHLLQEAEVLRRFQQFVRQHKND